MTSTAWLLSFLAPLTAYLLGGVPFGLLIGLARGVDIRTVGSKNIGATNLGRTLGVRYFWLAFFLDALKGLFPVLVTSRLVQTVPLPGHWASLLPLITAAAAVLGHVYPIYLKFKGGKGVATSLGVVLGIWPIFTLAGLAAAVTFLTVFLTFRYISLASIIASFCFVAAVFMLALARPTISGIDIPAGGHTPLLVTSVLFAALIIVKHRANIQRLRAGTEPKFGRKKEA